MQTSIRLQFPNDGKYVVSGDYSGQSSSMNTMMPHLYTTEMDYLGQRRQSSWVCGMGISADGSTIAVGTLVFTSSGGYDGEVYVYNNNSPTPLWIYSGMGDMVQCVDLSA